ncbi:hypothetical protein KKG83_00465 [Candidatus Micrarchaeota archaeon]|nr:hypothetical protein [Candidatus Micrarchaeota archaeon]MBU2475924.1 hypothetical protein [Candidatus Micrarchaeota archaeon]
MNKLVLLFCILLIPFSYAINAEPFVSFPGEKVVLEFDSKASVEMKYYYNLNLLEECTQKNCPLFENNSLKDSGKKKFVLSTENLKPGFYAFEVTENEEKYFSSVVVRPDYRLFIALALIILIGLVFLVERNVIGKN